ncbi:hypothetical protein ACB092_11G224800 [Castanea dentata]
MTQAIQHNTEQREGRRYLKFRNPEALPGSNLKASKNFKNFNLEYKQHSKQNHPNYSSRSQSSLESSSKASRNLNKPQIGKALRIQASKAPKNFHHKPSNTKNTRRTRRTHEEHEEREEHEEQRISNKLIARDSL